MLTKRAHYVRLSDGGRLWCELRGDLSSRTPILLNRPIGGSLDLWGAFADRLADAFPLIAFDPRGVARSSDPPLLHSSRAMARDAVELLDTLGVTRAHVFGISLGGMVASWLAVDAPERVACLVLASTLPSSRAFSLRLPSELLRLASALATPGLGAEVALVHGVLSPEFCHVHPERVTAIDRSLREHPNKVRNLLVFALAAARHHAGQRLRRVSAPCLLLFADRDPIVAERARRQLLAELPRPALEIITDSGHDLTLEQPELTAERVIAFLQRSERRANTAPPR
jgi:3-oxoadipate enol-lactonase